MMSISHDHSDGPTKPAVPEQREFAIEQALNAGYTTKTEALRNAPAMLRDLGCHADREELVWSWGDLVRSGRIQKVNRRWEVATTDLVLARDVEARHGR